MICSRLIQGSYFISEIEPCQKFKLNGMKFTTRDKDNDQPFRTLVTVL